MPDRPVIFISYSRKDSEFVERLSDDLKTHGFEPWVDRYAGLAGQDWSKEIEKAIKRCQALLVVLSPTSVESENVRNEYTYAFRANKHVIPLCSQKVELPLDLVRKDFIDFQDYYTQGLQRLISALNRFKLSSVPDFTTPEAPFVAYPSSILRDRPKFEPLPTTPAPPKELVDDTISRFPKSSQSNTLRNRERTRREISIDTGSSSPQTGLHDLAPPPSKNKQAFGDLISELDEEERIITWISASCLLIGVGVAVAILTKSWQWSFLVTLVTAVVAYLLGYRKGFSILVIAGMTVISLVITFALLTFLKLPDYNIANSGYRSLLSFSFPHTTIYVSRQVNFALITGLACGIISFIIASESGSLDDELELGLAGVFLAGGSFALLLWGILFFVGTYFNWGFGYGAGWWLSLIMLAVGFIAGVGIALLLIDWLDNL